MLFYEMVIGDQSPVTKFTSDHFIETHPKYKMLQNCAIQAEVLIMRKPLCTGAWNGFWGFFSQFTSKTVANDRQVLYKPK